MKNSCILLKKRFFRERNDELLKFAGSYFNGFWGGLGVDVPDSLWEPSARKTKSNKRYDLFKIECYNSFFEKINFNVDIIMMIWL